MDNVASVFANSKKVSLFASIYMRGNVECVKVQERILQKNNTILCDICSFYYVRDSNLRCYVDVQLRIWYKER